MNERLDIATRVLCALLARAHPHTHDPASRPSTDGKPYGDTYTRHAFAWADRVLAEAAKFSPPAPAEPPAPPAEASGAGGEMVCCWGSCDLVGDVDLATGAPFCRAHLCCELGARLIWARRVTPPKEAARRAGELAEKFGGGS